MSGARDSGRQPSIKVSSKNFNNSKIHSGVNSDKLRKRGTTSSIPDKQSLDNRKSEPINSDDIQNLVIKDEDLQRIRQSFEVPMSERSVKPAQKIRYTVRKQQPQQKELKKTKKIVVARTAPADAVLKPIDYSGPPGPRYNQQDGQIIPHSLLGSVEDFVSEAIRQNYMTPEYQSNATVADSISGELNIKPKSKPIRKPVPIIPTAINQENALINWRRKMMERKKQQGYISNLLQKPIDRLAMNQDVNYREIQEMRHLVDRAIPAVDYGKGFRVGSEFWRQHESFGDDITGIKMTITKTERGDPVEFERVRKPTAVLQEIGMGENQFDDSTVNPSCQWTSNEYLIQRCQQLEPIMKELNPYNTDITELQVIGKSPRKETSEQENIPPEDLLESKDQAKDDHGNFDNFDPLAKYPDVIQDPVLGPSIIFGGCHAQWTSPSNEHVGKIGHVSRVLFETSARERTTSNFEVKNNGTTAIYYDWRKVEIPPSFAVLKTDKTQRFYFNTNEGVILPNETKQFDFVFKSSIPGIFTETWQFLTEPVVMGGASLQIVLKGIAVEEDPNFEERNIILKDLQAREANEIVSSLIDQIIRSVRTPDRPLSPVDAYITEEEIFHRKNPGKFYDYETVVELKNFYLQLFPEETRENQEWNLSLSDLRDCILAVPDAAAQEELLSGLSTVVNRLSFQTVTPEQNQMYDVCYNIWQNILDSLCSCSMKIRNVMDLPEVIMEPIVDTDTSVTLQPSAADTKDDKKAKGGKKSTGKEDPKAKAKGGKKDAKEKDRPKSKDPKGGKGKTATTPTKDASLEREVASKTPSSLKPAVQDSLDPETRKKYNEKLYSMVYCLICNGIETMVDLFEEIKTSNES